MKHIHIGTSGFGVGQGKYKQLFSCVEVQHTFYQPPALATLERWRQAAPPDFEFVLKAWQLITHDARSPTYRRLKRKLSEPEKETAGYFRPSTIVKEAWETTLACAKVLKARTILFQCPASFKPTRENVSNFEAFFSDIRRDRTVREHFNFCWEPRGDWEAGTVRHLCDELDLTHVVDPFAAESVTPDRLYYRLHGRSGWRYEYDDPELRELAARLRNSSSIDDAGLDIHPAYVFFNNVRMIQDALRFKGFIGEM